MYFKVVNVVKVVIVVTKSRRNPVTRPRRPYKHTFVGARMTTGALHLLWCDAPGHCCLHIKHDPRRLPKYGFSLRSTPGNKCLARIRSRSSL